jgi:hypothetical protein
MPDLSQSRTLDSANTSVVKGEPILNSRSLQIASRHLAGLAVLLQLVADLLAFDDFAHTGALDGRDMDECVRTTIIRLDEAEALGGIEPFSASFRQVGTG